MAKSDEEDRIECADRKAWRRWLRQNHAKRDAVWLIYYKKHSNAPSVTYTEAVEEALCWGWIDGLRRRLDDQRFQQRFTPRRPRSIWSQVNKRAALRLIESGRMTRAGLEKIEEAKRNGRWDHAYSRRLQTEPPGDLVRALQRDARARKNFENFAPSYRRNYIQWISTAKREETRARRIQKVVEFARKNVKPLV